MASFTIPDVAVVGSINYDLFTYTPRLPQPGETIDGHSFMPGFGGKGANQAVMGGMLGGKVMMIGKVGDDAFGKEYLEHYESLSLSLAGIDIESSVSTGVANVTVEDSGENSIVIIKGANNSVTPEYVRSKKAEIQGAKVVICQNEIPLESTIETLRLAKEGNSETITVFNPAPASASLPTDIFTVTDVICPNETEAAIILGRDIQDEVTEETCREAARLLLEKGAKSVCMTLGSKGALVATSLDDMEIVPAMKLDPKSVVDTTGAGDSFIGSLGYFLSKGCTLKDSVGRAVQVAALSVQKKGAQQSYPTLDQLPKGIFEGIER